MKRSRRGGRRPQHGSHNQGGGGGGNGGGGFNPNRTFDSTGPEVKIRGSAAHIYEKYLQLARDANTSGDRVMAENYLQHAEHYYRILAQQQQQMQQYQAQREAQFQASQAARAAQQAGGDPYAGNNGSSGASFNLNEGGTEAAEADGNQAEEVVPENEGF
ncbi:MAG TPA: DUF4167 domain-containing protein [Rhizomicrobium sp.]|nr:DUF4167 domain-containing protein [Rhizomicrobium sp.]